MRWIERTLLALGASLIAAPLAAQVTEDGVVDDRVLIDASRQAERPNWDPRGERLVATAGADGAGNIVLIELDSGDFTDLVTHEADDRDPSFMADGEHVLFSSNRGGTYDLYRVSVSTGDVERLTDWPGDETEPVASPVEFTFDVAVDDGCGPIYARTLDSYAKIAFTYEHEGDTGVWFVSDNGVHSGRISPEGDPARAPSWSANGLSLAWSQDGDAIVDTIGAWEQDLQAAWSALREDADDSEEIGCYDAYEDTWQDDECVAEMTRYYVEFDESFRTDAGYAAPDYSANQTMLVTERADAEWGLWTISRGGQLWLPLAVAGAAPRHPAWSPDGQYVAYDSGGAIHVATVETYLQDVINLVDYPELWGMGTSELLQANGFVARPGEHREFFDAYDQIAYARRGPYITVDATLQAMHDEMTQQLQRAEDRAEEHLRILSTRMSRRYLERLDEGGDETDAYLATVFTVAQVLLDAGSQMRRRLNQADEESFEACWGSEDCLAELDFPVPPPDVVALREEVDALMDEVDPRIRDGVRQHVDRVLAHETMVLDWRIPGDDRDYAVDFTQFQVRGHYVSARLHGYFLATLWFGLVPLPLGEAAFALLDDLENEPTDLDYAPTVIEFWDRVDTLVGGFMGQPVDVSISHLRTVRDESPELLEPFDADAVSERLHELRGEIPVRGIDGAMGTGDDGQHPLRFSLIPRRLGADVPIFTRLTHPDVELRPFPSALDVFAGAGVEQAVEHAGASVDGDAWADAYRSALSELVEDTGMPVLSGVDIYSSWLAALIGLARVDSHTGGLGFTDTDAWADRMLASALAGYTQLKHSAVLYAFQETGVQCGGSQHWLFLTEQPVLPTPAGFVDPVPATFRALTGVAEQMAEALTDGRPTEVGFWPDDEPVSLVSLTTRLADIAEREVAGETLTEEDHQWIFNMGGRLENLFLRTYDADDGTAQSDTGRQQRGVMIATDLYTNAERGQVLQVAIGPLWDLYVAVPADVGRTMTTGPMFSFYEFIGPADERLTDEAWAEQVDNGDIPDPPSWTSSFLESP